LNSGACRRATSAALQFGRAPRMTSSQLPSGGPLPLGAVGVRRLQRLMVRPPPAPGLLDPRPAGMHIGEEVVGAALVDRERYVDADIVPAGDSRLVIGRTWGLEVVPGGRLQHHDCVRRIVNESANHNVRYTVNWIGPPCPAEPGPGRARSAPAA